MINSGELCKNRNLSKFTKSSEYSLDFFVLFSVLYDLNHNLKNLKSKFVFCVIVFTILVPSIVNKN